MLSIEEAFDRTLSLPSTPLVREAPTNFSSLVIEDREGVKSRSGSEKSKGREERRERMLASPTTSGSMALSKRTFLEGLKRRTRTRSGDNLFQGDDRRGEDEEVLPARRASEASQKLVSLFFGSTNEKLILDTNWLFLTLSKHRSEMPMYS